MNRKTSLVVAAAVILPAAALASPAGAANHISRSAVATPVGRVAYVTTSGKLDLSEISSDGSVSGTKQIGPVTSAPRGGNVTISDPMASQNGGWVAWTEVDESTKNGGSYRSWIILRRNGTGKPVKINTTTNFGTPIGFVGQHLAVGGNGKVWVVRTGSNSGLRLIAHSRKDTTFFATDAAGVIFEHGFGLSRKPEHIDLLELNGHVDALHTFPASMFPKNKAPLEQGWASPDGREAVFEQGDHTDFGGVGPTSEAFAISGKHSGSADKLGHPGKASPTRRMEQTSFADDTPFAVWATITHHTPFGSVYEYEGHGWHLVAAKSLVVAGNEDGDVITQPSKYAYAEKNEPAPDYVIVPTANAILHDGTSSVNVHLKALAMVWLD